MQHSMRILGLLIGLTSAGLCQAMSSTAMTDMIFGGLTNATDATSDATSSRDDDKVVLAARDDAARYVATHGEQRGAYLEAALTLIRQQQPDLQATDMQLAEAILSR